MHCKYYIQVNNMLTCIQINLVNCINILIGQYHDVCWLAYFTEITETKVSTIVFLKFGELVCRVFISLVCQSPNPQGLCCKYYYRFINMTISTSISRVTEITESVCCGFRKATQVSYFWRLLEMKYLGYFLTTQLQTIQNISTNIYMVQTHTISVKLQSASQWYLDFLNIENKLHTN